MDIRALLTTSEEEKAAFDALQTSIGKRANRIATIEEEIARYGRRLVALGETPEISVEAVVDVEDAAVNEQEERTAEAVSTNSTDLKERITAFEVMVNRIIESEKELLGKILREDVGRERQLFEKSAVLRRQYLDALNREQERENERERERNMDN